MSVNHVQQIVVNSNDGHPSPEPQQKKISRVSISTNHNSNHLQPAKIRQRSQEDEDYVDCKRVSFDSPPTSPSISQHRRTTFQQSRAFPCVDPQTVSQDSQIPLPVSLISKATSPSSSVKSDLGKVGFKCKRLGMHGRRRQKFRSSVASLSDAGRSRVQDIFLKSDIHGLPEWYEATSFSTKLVWSLILILAFVLLIYELVYVVNGYLENPILTTYSVVYEPHGMKFPNIYICPMSAVHYQAKLFLNVSKEWKDAHNITGVFDSGNFARDGGSESILQQKFTLHETAHGSIDPGQHEPDPCWRERAEKTSSLSGVEYTPENLQDYFMKTGYPGHILFKECAFRTLSFNCSKYVTEVLDKDYGKCFVLNLKGMAQTTGGLGLSLVLDLETKNAYDYDNPPIFDSMILRIGSEEFQMTNEEKTQISPGQYSIIQLSSKKYNLIERASTIGAVQICTPPEEGKRSLKILNVPYNVEACRLDCVEDIVLRHCNCVLPIDLRYLQRAKVVRLGKDPFCYADKIATCARKVIVETHTDDRKFMDCYLGCKVPCEFWEFKSTQSISRFPSEQFINTAVESKRKKRSVSGNGIKRRQKREENEYRDDYDDYALEDYDDDSEEDSSEETSKQHVTPVKRVTNCDEEDEVTYQNWNDYAVLDISFPSLQRVEITQENSMTFTSFVSEVGGQVGLWIGASIVTMIKFFVILAPIFYASIEARAGMFGNRQTDRPDSVP